MYRRRGAAIVVALVTTFVLGSISVSIAADPKSSRPQSDAAPPVPDEPQVAPTTTGVTYVSFAGSNFETRDSSITYSDAGTGQARYQTSTNYELHVARLDLPQGSRITQLVWYVYDNDASNDASLFLTRWGADTGYDDVDFVGTSGTTAVVQTLTSTLNLVVDNSSNTYVLQARLWAGTSSIQLWGARVGYIAPTFSFVPLTPARLLDSRVGNGLSGTFSSTVARTFAVTGRGGVPADAVAVTGNLTVTQQTSAGFVALTPAPINNPGTSTLNFPVGDNRANGVTVALSGTGTLSATYVGEGGPGTTTHLVFDVTGYFVP